MNIVLQKMQKDSQKFFSDASKKPLIAPPIQAERQDAPLPDDLTEIRQMAFKHVGDEVLYAEATFPKQPPASGKLPVAIYFHGGGLIGGNCGLCPVFRRDLAQLGYLVYSVDYRLIDKADAHGMFSDACDAFAFIHQDLQQHHGDPDRVFVIGESAGAFVSRFAVAAAHSRKLRALYQLPDPLLRFRGVIFFSGMFYLTRNDPVGMVYKKDAYGLHLADRQYMQYLDPDDPKINRLLPPVYLTSSRGDFLRSYTLQYANALKAQGHSCKLWYAHDRSDLSHAFPSLMPSLPESKDILHRIHRWMEHI